MWTIELPGATITLHDDGTFESQGTPVGLTAYLEPGNVIEVCPTDEGQGDIITLHE